ncbi:hypothetical protein DPMN_017747 [Dreissena polymorpha]|uniref:Uncharacterized protein n=1 Tax=Dreissena polymorpha TaxID=45954 RepID=A0A9D4NHG7_DREPO|nr:hypothetical protein DPMN_017747 [Dreissena polymorpha]
MVFADVASAAEAEEMALFGLKPFQNLETPTEEVDKMHCTSSAESQTGQGRYFTGGTILDIPASWRC